MTLRLLGHGPKHWRNGTTFFGRTVCALVGEQRYDNIRVYKRTCYAEWWYAKQTFFHWLYINKNDWANFFALIPKPDSSHGFPWKETPSRYAQFSDDTPNSDGYANWLTYFCVGFAAIWETARYFWPRRFINSYDFLSENNKERLAHVDGMAVASYEQSCTFWWDAWRFILAPHEYHRFREDRFLNFPPDSRFQSITISINRKNEFYDHHWRGVGMDTVMG